MHIEFNIAVIQITQEAPIHSNANECMIIMFMLVSQSLLESSELTNSWVMSHRGDDQIIEIFQHYY